ncbi:MAG: hypothetical protein MUC63_11245 [Planctomycetes bacterium]|nr:hypothetical protein [Planctomycetota bacterium]
MPLLIRFLQDDAFVYQAGDDLGIPAWKARRALKAIAGFAFPFDVRRSAEAWTEAAKIRDLAGRAEALARILPDPENPFLAALVGSPRPGPGGAPDRERIFATVRIRNVAPEPMTLGTRPAEVELQWAGGASFYGPGKGVPEAGEFTTLEPGLSMELEIPIDGGFARSQSKDARMNLTYRRLAKAQGRKAWIGILPVSIGEEWKVEGKPEPFERRWPNGNLRFVGAWLNGRETGRWHYFNENGDRVRIVEYVDGLVCSETECNPDHADNKGAGVKPKGK